MSEWWTYGLSDFLLFSPRTYYRLIERHNVGVWPAQLVTIGLGLGILWLLRRPAPARARAISAVLAILWAWVAWMFVWRRYAGINWAAGYFVWLFVVEVALLTWIGVVRGRPGIPGRAGCDRRARPGSGRGVGADLSVACPARGTGLGRGGDLRHRPGSDGGRHARPAAVGHRPCAVGVARRADPALRYQRRHALGDGITREVDLAGSAGGDRRGPQARFIFASKARNRGCERRGWKRNEPLTPYRLPARSS